MRKIILPINNPPILAYQYLAFPLSILSTQEQYLPWFYSNYIQLICKKNITLSNTVFLDFYSHVFEENFNETVFFTCHPFLEIKNLVLPSNVLSADLFFSMLIEKYYVYLKLNEFFLPNRSAFQRDHYFHDNLLHGVDEKNKEAFFFGFNKNKNYSSDSLSFEKFELALESTVKNFRIEKETSLFSCTLFRARLNGQYSFDLKLVLESLQDYIIPRNSSINFANIKNIQNTDAYAFGIEIYSTLNEYLGLLSEKKVNFDIRPFQLLWEHKKCMVSRVSFIKTLYKDFDPNAELSRMFKEIEQQSLLLRNLMLLALNKSDPAASEKMQVRLTNILKLERISIVLLIEQLIKIMENYDLS
ncbi:hypothetical protein [Cohnella soli]|uniref:Uncharacterized protein n=1 Tax=Cohnella soli TaxID=425005 RepID=A0ABW0HSX4_9BACL